MGRQNTRAVIVCPVVTAEYIAIPVLWWRQMRGSALVRL